MKVTRVAEMRALDRAAIEQFGIAPELLMENAGHAAYFLLRRAFGFGGKRFTIFCGLGNNGGDGLVLARKIHANGGEVQVFILGDPARFRGPAQTNFEIASRLPIRIERLESVEQAREAAHAGDLIVDAIFGTGLSREVQGLHREVIETINASGKPVLSIDIPSGVHGDTGKVMGVAVRADWTVTFGLPKIGNMLFPGYTLCGRLHLAHISFPPSLYAAEKLKVEINTPVALPRRDAADHQGTSGNLLTIAGAVRDPAAAYYAAHAFLKAGGGCSRLAAPESLTPFIAHKSGEIVLIPQEETAAGSIAMRNKTDLLELSGSVKVVVLGPGLSLQEETQELARELARATTQPLLLDDDGITALRQHVDLIRERQGPTVLTLRLDQMAGMADKSIDEVEQGVVDVLQETAQSLHAFIVLKGAPTLIAIPGRRVYINISGIPGSASAGSGHVLTGAIAAMFTLGLPLKEAVRQGVFVHGLAADLAAGEKGEDGLTAEDILEALPYAVKQCREGLSDMLRERYAGAVVI